LLVPIFTHSPSIYSGSRTAHSRRAAVGSSRGSAISRLEWNRAFGVKLRASDNISGRVEVLQATDKQVSVWSLKVGLFGIGNERAPQKDTVCPYKRRADNGTTYAVRVTTHKLQIRSESNIALNGTGTSTGGSLIRLFAVLGELEAGAAVTNAPGASLLRLIEALLQLLLERAGVHVIDKGVRTRTELNIDALAVAAPTTPGSSGHDLGGNDNRGDKGGTHDCPA